MVLQKRRSPIRGRKRMYMLAVCLLLAVFTMLGTGMSVRASASDPKYTQFEFTGEIEVLGIVDYDNQKCLHVNVPYEFVLDAPSPWAVIGIYITSELNGNSVGEYAKTFPFNSKETVTYIPLSDIGDFIEYGIYTIKVRAEYELLVATQPSEYATVQFEYIYKDTSVPLPEPPTKEGHTFDGWYYGNGADCDNSCTAYDKDYIEEDTDLHAHFEINVYTITFDSNGGELVSSISAEYNTTPELPVSIRTGYNFIGWTLPSGLDYDSTSPLKGNLTLTAKWELKTFTVTFYVDNEIYKSVTVTYGTTLQEAAKKANLQNKALLNENGVRLSVANSVITDNVAVLTTDMSKAEKFGAFLGRNLWIVWTALGLIGVLVVLLIVIKKRG